MTREYYLDHNATTPLHPRVRDAMGELLSRLPGNPSSLHEPGRESRGVVERARVHLASLVGADPGEIYFTSGGTESNNLVILGSDEPEAPLYIGALEHPSVTQPARHRWGGSRPDPDRGAVVPVDTKGGLQRPDRVLPHDGRVPEGTWVSLQWVNNETGRIQELAPHVREWRERGAFVHTDGAQGFFRIPVSLAELSVDAATITAHKSFGPSGVGALYLKSGVFLEPGLRGGPQERSLRPGTENVLGIHGMGVLAQVAQEEELWPLEPLQAAGAAFRSEVERIEDLRLLGDSSTTFPSVLAVALPDLPSEAILVQLDRLGVYASNGAACSSGSRRPSSTLQALGLEDPWLGGVVRFSFGPQHGVDDMVEVARRFQQVVTQLRRPRRG